jgi:hypothetical protein
MKNDGISPDAVAYTCILAAITDLKSLTIGKQIHAQVQVIWQFKVS